MHRRYPSGLRRGGGEETALIIRTMSSVFIVPASPPDYRDNFFASISDYIEIRNAQRQLVDDSLTVVVARECFPTERNAESTDEWLAKRACRNLISNAPTLWALTRVTRAGGE